MRNSRVSYDVDVNTTTCDCCGGEFYDDAILRVYVAGEDNPKRKISLCEECVEELPEPLLTEIQHSDTVGEYNWEPLVEHCKRSRVLNFLPASEQINDEKDVREFFAALTRYLVWHPETDFADYESKNGKKLFEPDLDGQLNECMRKAFEVCERITKQQVDPYEIAFEEQAKANKGMAAAMGRDHNTGKWIEQTPDLRVDEVREFSSIKSKLGRISDSIDELLDEKKQLREQRDQLLAACKYVEERLADAVDGGVQDKSPFYPSWIKVKEAIARAEKEGV